MSTYDLIAKELAQTFGLDPAEISPSRSFADLGIDSLALVELAVIVRAELGSQTDLTRIAPDTTLGEAADMIERAA
ncbi:acyl carrier protein [Nonomuraea sp. NPDC046802]|uniref:acyl carrier protein n=1 Tax=Nonomuraea sp. NPDC046802 TaxID=3154919 RepID=UPI0033EA3B5A